MSAYEIIKPDISKNGRRNRLSALDGQSFDKRPDYLSQVKGSPEIVPLHREASSLCCTPGLQQAGRV